MCVSTGYRRHASENLCFQAVSLPPHSAAAVAEAVSLPPHSAAGAALPAAVDLPSAYVSLSGWKRSGVAGLWVLGVVHL